MDIKGKIFSFLGDSITEGTGVENIAENRYDNIIMKRELLKTVYNYGIGGTRIAHQQTPSAEPRHDLCFCGRAYDINPNSDVIIVFGGTNDYGHGDAPFGVMTDKTPATFCGAVDFLMNYLTLAFPNALKIFLTPPRREGDLLPGSNPTKLDDAKPLKDYAEVIKHKAKEYNIPVLDLYSTLAIDPNKPEDKKQYAPDGLHLNDEGHKIMAQQLLDFMKNI